jgi:hypothetical protein
MSTSDSQSSSLYNWKDVTSKFREACSELEIGELVRDKKYYLQSNFFKTITWRTFKIVTIF